MQPLRAAVDLPLQPDRGRLSPGRYDLPSALERRSRRFELPPRPQRGGAAGACAPDRSARSLDPVPDRRGGAAEELYLLERVLQHPNERSRPE
jgi:hypothetical protein